MTESNNEKKGNDQENLIPVLTDMAISALSMKEMFDSWIEAGFTENQAIGLLAKVIVESGKEDGTK